MKRLLSLIPFLLIGISSCMTTHKGSFQTNVVLSEPNYKYIRTVSGEATATYFLAAGSRNGRDVLQEAKENLYKNADLTANQEIVNVSLTENKSNGILIFRSHTFLLTADVIEWTTNGEYLSKAEALRLKELNKLTTEYKMEKLSIYADCYSKTMSRYEDSKDVTLADIVYLKDKKTKGIVIEINKPTITIEIFDEDSTSTIKKQDFDDLRKINCK